MITIKQLEFEEALVADGKAVITIRIEDYAGKSFLADSKEQAFALLMALEKHMNDYGGLATAGGCELLDVENLINKLKWRTP